MMEGETLFCYKDMTFCNSDCSNTRCHRNFSPEQRANAIKWWGDDTFPIAWSADYRVDCPDYELPVNMKEINDAKA